jgi:hypothetical protein
MLAPWHWALTWPPCPCSKLANTSPPRLPNPSLFTVRFAGPVTVFHLANFALDCPTQSKHCEGCSGVSSFAFSECKFCYDSAVTSCQYSDASCTDSDGTCPNIESLNPPSMLQGDAGVTSVDLSGLFSFTGSTAITNLVCMWDVDTTATVANAQTASGITATSITCPIPASLPLGAHTVSSQRRPV